jgi:predicted porin
MKKHLIAAAVAAAFAVPATAQVTVSGSIHAGVMATGAPGAAGDAQVFSLGGGMNAINLSATEDLGGGLRGGFDGQIRFNAATGDRNSSGTGNALMHNANVFIAGGFGTVRVGKIAEAGNCAFDPWGCGGGAGTHAGAGGTLSALIAAGTQAQSLSYTSPTISGFSFGYQSSLSTRANERTVGFLSFAQGPFSAQVLQSKSSANTAADTAGAAPAITDVGGKGTSIGASYNFGVARLNIAQATTENAAGVNTAKITTFSGSAPLGAFTLLVGYNKAKTGGSYTATAANDTKWAVGVNYALSKRTTIGADLFDQEQTGGDTGFVLRARHTF